MLSRMVLSLLCLALSSCASQYKLATVHLVDTNGFSHTITTPTRLEQFESVDFLSQQPYKKVFRTWKEKVKEGGRSVLTSYYPSGQIMQYLEGRGGKAWGSYREWHENGHLRVHVRVIAGQLDFGQASEDSWIFDGLSEAFDDQGCLEAQIPYVHGSKEGLAKLYHTSGKLWQQMSYKNDALDGEHLGWYEDGQLFFRQQHKSGNLDGKCERYWQDNKLAAQEIYEIGVLVFARYYNCDGQLLGSVDDKEGTRVVFGKNGPVEIQTIHHGLVEGPINFFDDHGHLCHQVHVVGGLKHGVETFYYECKQSQTPQPKISMQWKEGLLHGTVRTWYETGQLQTEKQMIQEQIHGPCVAYYPDGSARLIENYEHGLLVHGDYFAPGSAQPVCSVQDGNGRALIYSSHGETEREIQYLEGLPQQLQPTSKGF